MLKKIKNKNKNNRKDKCMGKYKLVLYLILYNNKLMCGLKRKKNGEVSELLKLKEEQT